MRARRVALFLGAVCGSLVVAALAGESHFGSRIFLANASSCEVVLSEEHGGATIRPGGKELVRSGFIDHSPTMMVATSQQTWTGVSFYEGLVQVRTRNGDKLEVAIPSEWWKRSALGKELTFEVNGAGEFVLQAPTTVGAAPRSQPSGFPLPGLPAGMPIQKELACH